MKIKIFVRIMTIVGAAFLQSQNAQGYNLFLGGGKQTSQPTNQPRALTVAGSAVTAQNDAQCMRWQQCVQAQDAQYRQKFGANLGYHAVEKIMSYGHEEVVRFLISSRKTLSDQQVIALWTEYKLRGNVKERYLQECEDKINYELQDRQKTRQAAIVAAQIMQQQEEQRSRLSSQSSFANDTVNSFGQDDDDEDEDLWHGYDHTPYNGVSFQGHRCPYEHLQSAYEQRQQALQKTIESDFIQFHQEHKLPAHVIAYLNYFEAAAVDFSQFYGTALQQQFHGEVCTLLDSMAMRAICERKPMSFGAQMMLLSQMAYNTNQAELIETTAELVDGLTNLWHFAKYCTQLTKHQVVDLCQNPGKYAQVVKSGVIDVIDSPVQYANAVKCGVVDSVTGLMHAVTSPIETGKQMAKIASSILELAAYNLALDCSDPYARAAIKHRDQLNAQARCMLQAWCSEIAQATGPERVKMLTQCVADFKISPKLLEQAGKLALFGGAKIASEYKKIMQPWPELVELEGMIGSAAKEELLMQLNEVSQEVSRPSVSCWAAKAKELHQAAKKYNFQIPISDVKLVREIESLMQAVVREVNISLDPALIPSYGVKKVGIKKIEMNVQHVLQYELQMSKKGKHLEISLRGGHVGGSVNKLEKAGVIKITNKIEVQPGCWHYEFTDVFTGKPYQKTEFPGSWNHQKIVDACWDAYGNFTEQGQFDKSKKDFRVKVVDDIEVMVIFKNFSPQLDRIATVHPKIG